MKGILRLRDDSGREIVIPAIQGKDGKDYVLTSVDKEEIAEMAAELVKVPTDEHINGLINTALGVIENGTY